MLVRNPSAVISEITGLCRIIANSKSKVGQAGRAGCVNWQTCDNVA